MAKDSSFGVNPRFAPLYLLAGVLSLVALGLEFYAWQVKGKSWTEMVMPAILAAFMFYMWSLGRKQAKIDG
ncbi:hypothetical protein ACOYW6_03715 [Parablastomonas sp. CN1-191]|uniref:hypothetical protein n=1 Tax=Parablastomonas sp. CN1-191 TaxID=3400908 RepID=UPI003BF872E7